MRVKLKSEDFPGAPEGFEWYNTPGYSEYAVAGKPLHLVDKATNKSLCGIYRKQWSFDLFNVEPCKRCKRSLECKQP